MLPRRNPRGHIDNIKRKRREWLEKLAFSVFNFLSKKEFPSSPTRENV